MAERIICLAVGYLFGLFQTGYFIGLIKHRDIRNYGSGNSGTTNAIRVLGRKAGAIVFVGDMLKALLACLLIKWTAAELDLSEDALVLMVYCGFGVVLGHNFPFYLHFNGGKGIASSWGIALAIDWRMALVAILVFSGTMLITKYVSLGSLLGLFSFAVMWVVLLLTDGIVITAAQIEATILLLIVIVLGFVRHKANIKRLLSGTENKIGQRVKLPEADK